MRKWLERVIYFKRYPALVRLQSNTTHNVKLTVQNFCEHPECEGHVLDD